MADKSRAEYFRERRKNMKQLVFMVDREKADSWTRSWQKRGSEEQNGSVKSWMRNFTKKNRNSPPPSKSHGLFLKHHSRRSGKSMIPHLQGKYKEDTMAGR